MTVPGEAFHSMTTPLSRKEKEKANNGTAARALRGQKSRSVRDPRTRAVPVSTALKSTALQRISKFLEEDNVGTDIDFSIMELDNLPKELAKCEHRLTNLVADRNKFKQIPNVTFTLYNLTSLNLSNNLIELIPVDLFLLRSLASLNLSSNAIKEIPEEISFLPQLEDFNISHNKLAAVPLTLCELVKLNFIDVSHNSITVLPGELSLLPQLRTLNCMQNPCYSKLNSQSKGIKYALSQLIMPDLSNSAIYFDKFHEEWTDPAGPLWRANMQKQCRYVKVSVGEIVKVRLRLGTRIPSLMLPSHTRVVPSSWQMQVKKVGSSTGVEGITRVDSGQTCHPVFQWSSTEAGVYQMTMVDANANAGEDREDRKEGEIETTAAVTAPSLSIILLTEGPHPPNCRLRVEALNAQLFGRWIFSLQLADREGQPAWNAIPSEASLCPIVPSGMTAQTAEEDLPVVAEWPALAAALHWNITTVAQTHSSRHPSERPTFLGRDACHPATLQWAWSPTVAGQVTCQCTWQGQPIPGSGIEWVVEPLRFGGDSDSD